MLSIVIICSKVMYGNNRTESIFVVPCEDNHVVFSFIDTTIVLGSELIYVRWTAQDCHARDTLFHSLAISAFGRREE